MTRRLVIMRHGRAEPYAATDHDRELTDRGRAEARAAGEYLAAHNLTPDYALVSSAARTRATWDEVRSASGATVEASYEPRLYAATPEAILEVARLIPEDARTVLLVGHNPGAAYVAYLLDDGDGDPAVMRGLLEGFPTASVAALALSGTWADLEPASARITHFTTPQR